VRVDPAVTEESRRDPTAATRATGWLPIRERECSWYSISITSVLTGRTPRQPLVDTLRRVMSPTDLFGAFTPKMRPQDLTLGRKP
jgi:hypothetical protein